MEANNTKAMRDALEEIWKEANTQYWNDNGIDLTWLMSKAKSALSAPPRNCDVGTAEEQTDRFETFCASVHPSCLECKADEQYTRCELAWAQMPYDGGNDGVK